MLNFKALGAAALLALAPALVSTTADAQFANRGSGPRATILPNGQAVYVSPGLAGRPAVAPPLHPGVGRPGIGGGWAGPAARPGGWAGRPVGPRPGWNGGHRHRHYGGAGIGFATGLAAGAAIAGSSYYGPGYYSSPGYVVDDYDDEPVVAVPSATADADSYCRQRYRSYDPRTRTYLNNDGNRYPCP